MLSNSIYENRIVYNAEINRRHISVYWLVLLMITGALVALPFIKLDISVKSQGIIRPADEKTELKSSISSVIERIFFKEGDSVKKGDVIIQLRKENIAIKKTINDFEINQRNQFVADLISLTKRSDFTSATVASLQSPLYKQQCSRLAFQLAELNAQLKKINKELYIDSVLVTDRVIAPKEMFDKRVEYEKLIANIRATKEQQLASWQQELARYQLERSQYKNANDQLNEDSSYYSIKAPVTGVLQNFNKFYEGSVVQAGEALGIISPQAALVAECYVNTRDIGMLKPEQPTLFQVEAFDYNYFGVLTGKISTIDNDFTVIDNKPVFKVRCTLDARQMRLKNGFTGELKKGMTMQVRFVVARRSLWQLLFDKIDDWVNPTAPEKII